MKLNTQMIITLVLAHSVSLATAADGPLQLDEYGLDAVTAGSTNPVVPTHTSSAALALQNLPSFYSPFTSPSTGSTTTLPAGSASAALAWLQSLQNGGGSTSGTGTTSGTGSTFNSNSGTGSTLTSGSGGGSGDSQDEETTSSGGSNAANDLLANLGQGGGIGNNTNPGGGSTTPVVTTIPNAGTIDYTGSAAGASTFTIYTPQAPVGHLRDFFHHSVQNQW
ncbi:MAG: hypothetical protein KDI82_02485 [Gammaproteobacteria bacterium]|nr:hypothetical protein [Gammaproteobacteria bacterium]